MCGHRRGIAPPRAPQIGQDQARIDRLRLPERVDRIVVFEAVKKEDAMHEERQRLRRT